MLKLLFLIPVLLAAMTLGNWFLTEFRRLRKMGKPWYAAYCTLPGLMIFIVVVILPLLLRFFHNAD